MTISPTFLSCAFYRYGAQLHGINLCCTFEERETKRNEIVKTGLRILVCIISLSRTVQLFDCC